jgi:hypothetical protein
MRAVVLAGTRQVAVQDVPELYRSSGRRADGVIKAVLDPQAG